MTGSSIWRIALGLQAAWFVWHPAPALAQEEPLLCTSDADCEGFAAPCGFAYCDEQVCKSQALGGECQCVVGDVSPELPQCRSNQGQCIVNSDGTESHWQCYPSDCEPGARTCSDTFGFRTCRPDHSVGELEYCAPNQVCSAGQCQVMECDSDVRECSSIYGLRQCVNYRWQQTGCASGARCCAGTCRDCPSGDAECRSSSSNSFCANYVVAPHSDPTPPNPGMIIYDTAASILIDSRSPAQAFHTRSPKVSVTAGATDENGGIEAVKLWATWTFYGDGQQSGPGIVGRPVREVNVAIEPEQYADVNRYFPHEFDLETRARGWSSIRLDVWTTAINSVGATARTPTIIVRYPYSPSGCSGPTPVDFGSVIQHTAAYEEFACCWIDYWKTFGGECRAGYRFAGVNVEKNAGGGTCGNSNGESGNVRLAPNGVSCAASVRFHNNGFEGAGCTITINQRRGCN